MKKHIFLSVLFLAALASCTDETSLFLEEDLIEKVSFVVKDYEVGMPMTRSSLSSALKITWAENDKIGVFPTKGDQISFQILPDHSGQNHATFDSGGWALRQNYTYAAYYPYSVDNTTYSRTAEAIPFSYIGQAQSENDNTAHIGKYDYMYAISTSPTAGVAEFSFNHYGCLLNIPVSVPLSGTYTNLRIATEEAWLISEASININTGEQIDAKYTDHLDLKLNNLELGEGETLNAWMMMAPVNLYGKKMHLTLQSATANDLTIEVDGQNFLSSKAYVLSEDWSGTVDDALPYVTITSDTEGTFGISRYLTNMQYKVGNGQWTDYTMEEVPFGGSLGAIKLRAQSETGTAISPTEKAVISLSSTLTNVKVSGDLRTLVNYADYENTDLSNARFLELFAFCSPIVSAKDLIIPNPMTKETYGHFFAGCSNLTEAPALPAMQLSPACYVGMFWNCTSLVDAPELPATQLADYCYYTMFYGCSSLIQAPVLPAKTLVTSCYYQMFSGCTKLNYICMMGETGPENAFTDWMKDVAPMYGTGTLVFNSSASYSITSAANSNGWWYTPQPNTLGQVPNNITVDDNTVEYLTLSSTTQGEMHLSQEVKTLEYSVGGGEWKELGTGTVSFGGGMGDLRLRGMSPYGTARNEENYANMIFSGSESNLSVSGNLMTLVNYKNYRHTNFDNTRCRFIALFAGSDIESAKNLYIPFTWSNLSYHILFVGCKKLVEPPTFNDFEAAIPFCYFAMFDSCISLKKGPELPSKILLHGCYQFMFSNCTSLTIPSELPATQLGTGCYSGMFDGCTSLTYAPTLPAKELPGSCYARMFNGCSRLNYIKMLATSAQANAFGTSESDSWVSGVSSTGTLVIKSGFNPNTNFNYIPSGWSVQYEY